MAAACATCSSCSCCSPRRSWPSASSGSAADPTALAASTAHACHAARRRWPVTCDAPGGGQLLAHDDEIPALGTFGEGFIWLHLNLVDARLGRLIQEGRLGPQRIAEAAFSRDEHQRVVVDGAYVGGVVADLARKAGSNAVA